MKISLDWLNEYVNVDGINPADLSEDLTNSGLEVEGIESVGAAFSGVCLGKVLAVEGHPNADRLNLVTVDTGREKNKVVCGASNVREGILIAYASIGATVLSRKDKSTFQLERAKIRGVESCGMICSLDELGLAEKYSQDDDGGIWVMDAVAKEAQLGVDLKTVLELTADQVLDGAPTANRGDHMSMIGVAREVAALHNRPVTLPEIKDFSSSKSCEGFTIQLDDLDICEYYAGAVMKGLKIAPSPDWMARRLEAVGVRSINNVVDITNYVMLEMGQPLHAFDADKLGAGVVGVRRGKDGEKMITLDGEERKLSSESVLITKDDKPVALAGLMGGEETEIGDDSKNLFLESAYFFPQSNRRSAKSVGLRSEASARFERGVDRGACKKALFRAIQLYQELAGAEFIGLVESAPIEAKEVKITLRLSRMEKLLGVAIDKKITVDVLDKLGFAKLAESGDALDFSVPSYRQHDVYREVDLIEEVVRIYGYDNVPYTLPKKTRSATYSLRQDLLRRVRASLGGSGLQEAVTNSLIGESLLKKTGFEVNRDQLVQVVNSHSQEHTLMRQSLLPNLIEIAKYNLSQGVENVWLFEVGRTFFKMGKAKEKSSGVVEKLFISGTLTGSGYTGRWNVPSEVQPVDFYQAKGVVEQLLIALKLDGVCKFEAESETSYLHPGKTAKILLGKKSVGVLGQIHPVFESRLKIRQPMFVFELDFEAIYKTVKQQSQEIEEVIVLSYPAVKRDMAFSASETISHQKIVNVIQALNEPLLTDVDVFDEYRGEQLGEGQRSLAYRLTLQSHESTLTDALIDDVVARVKKALSDQCAVSFR